MFNVQIRDDELKKLSANIEKLGKETQEEIQKACFKVGSVALKDTRAVTPHKTGALVRSGNVKTLDGGKEAQSFSDMKPLGFGNTLIGFIVGFNKVYAHRRHEEHYKASKPNRGRKYLENTFKNNGQKYLNMVIDSLKSIFR